MTFENIGGRIYVEIKHYVDLRNKIKQKYNMKYIKLNIILYKMILNKEAFKLDKRINELMFGISEYENSDTWTFRYSEESIKEDKKKLKKLLNEWDKFDENFKKELCEKFEGNDLEKCKEELIKYIKEIEKKLNEEFEEKKRITLKWENGVNNVLKPRDYYKIYDKIYKKDIVEYLTYLKEMLKFWFKTEL